MVAHKTIKNYSFSNVSDLSKELSEPLDFTMSKFKSSSPTKHPLYYQFYGNNSDTPPNHDATEEQGKVKRMKNQECRIKFHIS